MAFRLTVILLAAIFVIMRFAGGPIPEAPAPETAAVPEAEPAAPQEAAATPADAPAVSQTPVVTRHTPTTSEGAKRITLAPPATLAPNQTEDSAATQASLDGLDPPTETIISPEEALPQGFTGGQLGLGGALDLRDQVNAALDEAQDPPARPSLADLARPGGGQPVREAESDRQETDALAVPSAPEPDGPLATVIASSVNLRDGPSTLNAVIGRVTNGEILEMRGEFSGGWVAVGHPDTGNTAYISGQFLDPLGN